MLSLLASIFNRSRRPRNPWAEKAGGRYADFLLGKDPNALCRDRATIPAYFMAFTVLVRYTIHTNSIPDVFSRLCDLVDSGQISEEAVSGVDMTAYALAAAAGVVLGKTPAYEDWREFEKRLEESYSIRDPETKEAYINFAQELAGSIIAAASAPHAKVNEPVLRIAVMSAVLFAKTAQEEGVISGSEWAMADAKTRIYTPNGRRLNPRKAANALSGMFWDITDSMTHLLFR